MAWIESHQSLQRHPKTIRAATMLGIRPVHLIGHLHCLWWWALDYADPKGCLGANVSAKMVTRAADYPVRSADKFLNALKTCGGNSSGFIEEKDGLLYLHNWWDYAGKLIVKRQADRERKREKKPEIPAENPLEKPTEIQRTVLRTQPNRTQPTVPNQPDATTDGEQDPNLTAIVICYEQNIGMITPIIAEWLKDISQRYPPEWFPEAVKEGIRSCNPKRPGLAYIEKILERWKTEGFKSPKRAPGRVRSGAMGIKGPAPKDLLEE